MLTVRRVCFVLIGACAALCSVPGFAEWTTQRMELRPGWNSVFLDVQPDAAACETVFAGLPIRSVWTWNPKFASPQYVRDPSELLPEAPEWLTYFPPESPRAFLTDLRGVRGGSSYLIDLGGEATVTLTVHGNRKARAVKWMPDAFNLMGFHIDPDVLPSPRKFFAPSPAHSGHPVLRLTAGGKWEDIVDEPTARLHPGEAYWVYCEGKSTYSGPISVRAGGDRIDFGALHSKQPITLANASDLTKTVHLRLRSVQELSGRPSESGPSAYRGDVALAYYNLKPGDLDKKSTSWARISEDTSFVLEPHSEMQVILAVRRSEMLPPESKDDVYESVLQVFDGGGSLYTIPVSARKSLGEGGLWVGTVSVSAVSESSNSADLETPTPVGMPFQFRIIVHRDGDGKATLLSHVTLLEVDATYMINPEDPEGDLIIDVPAHTALLTRKELLPEIIGNSKLFGRRISAPIFSGLPPPRSAAEIAAANADATEDEVADEVTVEYADEGGETQQLVWRIRTPFDDPRNPFVHRYHPDHDNLDDRYDEDYPLAEGQESFKIVRTITLDFEFGEILEDLDSDGLLDPEFGGNMHVGRYHEKIEGVHRESIYVEGMFTLHLVSRVDQLDDGLLVDDA